MQFRRFYEHPITLIGIDPSMNYVKRKRIQMVNLIALSCIPFMVSFSIANFLDERYILSTINLTNTLFSIITLLLQHNKKYKIARLTLLLSSYICFLVGSLLFQNAGQYYLISILIITMLLYDNRRIHIFVTTCIIPSILCVEIFAPLITNATPIPQSRIIFNIIGSISFILIAINFYIQIIYNKMKKIENQRLRLLSANKDKEKIFSIIAHDIKSPFATLENLANALHEQIFNNEASKDFIEQICEKINTQNKTLDDLLKWGSSNIKGVKKNPSIILVKPLIEKLTLIFKEQSLLKKLTININMSKKTQVYANKDHLTIILRNFISNAIKFSYTNGIININSSLDNQRTYIHIQDNGIGINSQKSSILFNEIQNRSLGTLNEPGSGLGLLLCRDLIEQNNGTISIESEPKNGSIFTVGLPTQPNISSAINFKKELEEAYYLSN